MQPVELRLESKHEYFFFIFYIYFFIFFLQNMDVHTEIRRFHHQQSRTMHFYSDLKKKTNNT